MKAQADEFRRFLDHRGLRLTRERGAILAEVARTRGHFDPEELHYSLRDKGDKVSRASIYRTLPLLIEAGILARVENTDKHAHYASGVLGKLGSPDNLTRKIMMFLAIMEQLEEKGRQAAYIDVRIMDQPVWKPRPQS